MTELVDLFKEFGFQVAVIVWLLYERRTTIKEHTGAIQKLTIAIEKLIGKLT